MNKAREFMVRAMIRERLGLVNRKPELVIVDAKKPAPVRQDQVARIRPRESRISSGRL